MKNQILIFGMALTVLGFANQVRAEEFRVGDRTRSSSLVLEMVGYPNQITGALVAKMKGTTNEQWKTLSGSKYSSDPEEQKARILFQLNANSDASLNTRLKTKQVDLVLKGEVAKELTILVNLFQSSENMKVVREGHSTQVTIANGSSVICDNLITTGSCAISIPGGLSVISPDLLR